MSTILGAKLRLASLGNFHVGGEDRDAQWRVCRAARCAFPREGEKETSCLPTSDGVLDGVTVSPTLLF